MALPDLLAEHVIVGCFRKLFKATCEVVVLLDFRANLRPNSKGVQICS